MVSVTRHPVVRPTCLCENIVFIDGMSHSGKTAVGPLLSSLHRSELFLLNHHYDWYCFLSHSGKIQPDVSASMLRVQADVDLYGLTIGRGTNFRRSDLSGVERNLMKDRYLKRIGAREGDDAVERIRKTRPFLIVMVHHLFGESEPLFRAFGKHLRLYLIVVRHPLWVVESWYRGKWERRFGRDPREFQALYQVNGKVVPCFAAGWEKEYLRLNPMEQSIRFVDAFTIKCEERLRRIPSGMRQKVMIIPFERFVTRPYGYLRDIAGLLGTRTTGLTSRLMKAMDIPRRLPAHYLEEKRSQMNRLVRRCRVSGHYGAMLDRLCRDYEDRYIEKAAEG